MAPRKTLNDVIEQLKVNNETTVDIDKGIAGLENQFGKFSPWGIKEKTDFDYYIKHNLIGSCK